MGSVRYQVKEKDGKEIVEEIHKVVVHKFNLGDVDDPEIYAAQPIWEWQQTDAGKFVMENAVDEPEWHKHMDQMWMGYTFIIIAELEKKKLAEYYLRFDKTSKV